METLAGEQDQNLSQRVSDSGSKAGQVSQRKARTQSAATSCGINHDMNKEVEGGRSERRIPAEGVAILRSKSFPSHFLVV